MREMRKSPLRNSRGSAASTSRTLKSSTRTTSSNPSSILACGVSRIPEPKDGLLNTAASRTFAWMGRFAAGKFRAHFDRQELGISPQRSGDNASDLASDGKHLWRNAAPQHPAPFRRRSRDARCSRQCERGACRQDAADRTIPNAPQRLDLAASPGRKLNRFHCRPATVPAGRHFEKRR
jgi:hypothetical protein